MPVGKMLVALGLFVKLAVMLVRNPVERHFVLLLRVFASVPLLNSGLLLREGSADAVGTPVVASSPATEDETAEAVAVFSLG